MLTTAWLPIAEVWFTYFQPTGAPSLGLSSAFYDGIVEVPDSASHGAWLQMGRHFQLSQSDTAVVLQE